MVGCSSSGNREGEVPERARPFWESSAGVGRDRIAAIDTSTGQTLTYGELWDSADQMAGLVRSEQKGLVFAFCQNDLRSLMCYIGALRSGHAVALLDREMAIDYRSELIGRYQPEWVLGLPSVEGYEQSGAPLAMRRLSRCFAATAHPDLALLLTTSGSTGSPKLVRLSYRAVHANAASIAEYLSLSAVERPITSLPMSYSYGLSVINSHMHVGAALVLTSYSVTQPELWRVMKEHGCTSFAGVPFQYEVLARLGLDKMELPELRTMTQAGGRMRERVRDSVAAMAAARGIRLFIMYGQTEATARMTYLPPERLRDRSGSVGVAIPGGNISIVSDGVRTDVAGLTGEVVYRGANVMMGYATCREDLGLGDSLGGELMTGDIGYLDAEGFLHLVGRTKRIAKIHGHRVNLDEVEALLSSQGRLAAVAADDEIVLHCEFGTKDELEALRAVLAGKLKLHHSVFHFHRVDVLPLTSSGKVDYARLGASA